MAVKAGQPEFTERTRAAADDRLYHLHGADFHGRR